MILRVDSISTIPFVEIGEKGGEKMEEERVRDEGCRILKLWRIMGGRYI